jgi:uncharacterized membrane protein YjjP (DUF1212 family)
VTRDEVLKAMTCSLRAGQTMLESSVSVSDVTEVMLRLTRAFGLQHCEVSITLNTITVCDLPLDEPPVTMVKVVDIREPRLDRLAAIETVTNQVEQGELGLEAAYDRIREIEHSEVPYPAWLTFLATLLSVAGWVVFAGGGLVAAAAGVVGALVMYPLVRWVGRFHLPVLVGTFIGGMVVVLVPNAFLAAGVGIALVPAVIGGLYPLLPGGALVASVIDGLSGAPISSLAKGLQAAVVALVLGLGVATAQALTRYLELEGDTNDVTVPFAGLLVATAVAIGALAVARGMTVSALLPTTALAVGAWLLVYFAPTRGIGGNAATAAAAGAIGLGGQLLARLQRMPGTIYTTSAVYVLVPGTAIYLAMTGFALGDSEVASQELFNALRTATAIAGGIAVGVGLGRSVPAPRPRVSLFGRTRSRPR